MEEVQGYEEGETHPPSLLPDTLLACKQKPSNFGWGSYPGFAQSRRAWLSFTEGPSPLCANLAAANGTKKGAWKLRGHT